MRTAGKLKLEMRRTFEAPMEAVFDAWTSPEVLRRWFHAEHDWETTDAATDPRVGGELRVVMRNPHEDVEHGGGGRYIEVSPPARLAFTWTWDDHPAREQLIEIDFEEQDGATQMTFVQIGLWDEEAVRSHKGGWTGAFDNLGRALGSKC
jgi:uncharacterized protein YndB with AHSA1/START domain